MGLFDGALSTVAASIADQLDDVEVKDHPGRFTEDELGKVLLKQKSVRVSIERIPSLTVQGDGRKNAEVQFVAFVICADKRGEDRHKSALELVERLIDIVAYSRWGHDEVFKAAPTSSIEVDNLYNGPLDNGKGISWWAVSWTQAIRTN